MSEYAAGLNRPPFNLAGRMVARRAFDHAGRREIGSDVPRLDLTDRQVAVLWEQGWVDTLPLPVKTDARGAGKK